MAWRTSASRSIAAAAAARRHRTCWAISCARLGLEWKRLKTGTPPRLDGRTIDWSRFEPQHGDADPTPFSFLTSKIEREQVPCYIAYTTAETHRILRDSIARSPLYSGQIEGIGPRYCPSIEDKIVKFPDKIPASDFSGAGGAGYKRNLREWDVDQHADRRSDPDGRVDSGLGECGDDPARLCDRIRCDRSAGADSFSGS